MENHRLNWKPILILLLLALIWGANMATIKIAGRQLAPLFMAGFRSLVASLCLFLWMKFKGLRVFPSVVVALHGMVVGLLFGAEFGLLYLGLEFTLASRAYVLLYTAPFFAALEAHIFLKGDRLTLWKAAGLVLAFSGVAALFIGDLLAFSLNTLPGDVMALCAGALWASTTVYLKRYLAQRTVPLQTLFYQVFFSAPQLLLLSFLVENPDLSRLSALTSATLFSLFYQCIIVAFLSYLVWFMLIHRYPASLLHAFSFFTPIFGVFLSGVLILGEEIHGGLTVSLLLVSTGLIVVNRPAKIRGRDTNPPLAPK